MEIASNADGWRVNKFAGVKTPQEILTQGCGWNRFLVSGWKHYI